MNSQPALQEYRQVNASSAINGAEPHQLVQMLLDGALDKLATARGHMARGETAEKGRQLSTSIAIISELRESLDHEKGGEIAANLNDLYLYMSEALLHANLRNDQGKIDEVVSLLRELRSAWNAIPTEQRVMRRQ